MGATFLAFLVCAGGPLGSQGFPYQAASSFAFDGDTRTMTGSYFDTYGCDSTKSEIGPELVFALTLSEEADVDVMVEVQGVGVDVDPHLLTSLGRDASNMATACIARDDRNAAGFRLPAGTYYVVADTYASVAKAGPFRLHVRVYPTAGPTRTTIAKGVTWVREVRRYDGYDTTLSHLELDPAQGAALEVQDNGTCRTVDAAPKPARAVAAVNAGFFDAACEPEGLLRAGGSTIELAHGVEHVVGFGPDGSYAFGKPVVDTDFTAKPSAVGGRGYLRLNGQGVTVDDDGAQDSFVNGRHERTAFGARADGTLALFTVDGNTAAGDGMTLAQLGAMLSDEDVALALNLDGGGSSTMWIKGEPLTGIVNHPSGNLRADHRGQRAVRSMVVVLADPVVPAPLFVTLPAPTTLSDGGSFEYAARAVAAEPVTYALKTAVDNATLSGDRLRFAPDVFQNGALTLELEACAAGACSVQSVPVQVTLADVDRDLLPDAWERQYGLEIGVDDAEDDADGDGASNLEEYQAKTDPGFDDRPLPLVPETKPEDPSTPEAAPVTPQNDDPAAPQIKKPLTRAAVGCDCASTGAPQTSMAVLGLALLWLRRRRALC